ncbi:MAG TPA: IS66 family insertion sequence element accessory protein TnpB [Gammaproteobacteria bacterium]
MLMLPPAVRIFVASVPVDLRRSFDGLAALVQEVIGEDPFSGHLFVFRNRLGHRVKILFWDRTGFCLWYKRLEQGVFRFPAEAARSWEIEASELMLLLEGIELAGSRRQRRYRRTPI